jgi:hypothetical protein
LIFHNSSKDAVITGFWQACISALNPRGTGLNFIRNAARRGAMAKPMSDSTFSEPDLGGAGRDEILSARFAQMVMQQAQMALMLLGKTPHPQTGETVRDLEAARMFIDQLEMIEAKTKGNLNKDEERLLKQNLMALRMAFVEAVAAPAPETAKPEAAQPAENKPAPGTAPLPPTEDESKKKFSKKY